MSVVVGSKPDLVFYYSLLLPSTIINSITLGSDIIQTAGGIIFADADFLIPIGNFAFNITIFKGLEEGPSKLLQFGVGTNVYFLPEGTISNSINLEFIKKGVDIFIVPSDNSNVFQILSGSGHFLNQRGFIVQIPDKLVGREMQVYFNK